MEHKCLCLVPEVLVTMKKNGVNSDPELFLAGFLRLALKAKEMCALIWVFPEISITIFSHFKPMSAFISIKKAMDIILSKTSF